MLLAAVATGAVATGAAAARAQYGHPGPNALCRCAQFTGWAPEPCANAWPPAPCVMPGMRLLLGPGESITDPRTGPSDAPEVERIRCRYSANSSPADRSRAAAMTRAAAAASCTATPTDLYRVI